MDPMTRMELVGELGQQARAIEAAAPLAKVGIARRIGEIIALLGGPAEPVQADQLGSKEFKGWFADSQVVDADGAPLVVYHGTKGAKFDAFKKDSWFAENPLLAHVFLGGGRSAEGRAAEGSSIYPVYLSIQKPLDLSDTDVMRTAYVGDFLIRAGATQAQLPELLQVMEAAVKPLRDAFLAKHFGKPGEMDGKFPVPGQIAVAWKPSTLEDHLRTSMPIWMLVEETGMRAVLERLGYDGVKSKESQQYNETLATGKRLNRRKNESVTSTTWMAFRPNQIKSATGNGGGFDPASDSIIDSAGYERTWRTEESRC